MSHFGVIVLIDKPDTLTEESILAAVDAVLDRYRDDKFDWFQVGGRWTGHFDGYDPEKDPATLEMCDLCGGTGDRATHRHEPRAGQHKTGCNGCLGTGAKQKWPTTWPFRAGDCKPASALTEKDLDIYAVVVSDYDWFGGERYEPWHSGDEGKFIREDVPPLAWLLKEHGDKLAVIVDCHN